DFAGVHTFKYRQSSLIGLSARSRKIMSEKIGACMQRVPNSVALRTPLQFFTGCGAFQRNSPTGGAANGIPRKTRTPGVPAVAPSTTPFSVRTSSAAATARPHKEITSMLIVTAAWNTHLPRLMRAPWDRPVIIPVLLPPSSFELLALVQTVRAFLS